MHLLLPSDVLRSSDSARLYCSAKSNYKLPSRPSQGTNVWGFLSFWERLDYCEDLPLPLLLWSIISIPATALVCEKNFDTEYQEESSRILA